MGKIQKIAGYRVVEKATSVIMAIVPKVNFDRFPEREYRHIPIWEDE